MQSGGAGQSFGSLVDSVYLLLLDHKPFEIPMKAVDPLNMLVNVHILLCAGFSLPGQEIPKVTWQRGEEGRL